MTADINPRQLQLPLPQTKRMCAKCGQREVYQDIATMDWCEPCIWRFVRGPGKPLLCRVTM
jgi:hypothetical protein